MKILYEKGDILVRQDNNNKIEYALVLGSGKTEESIRDELLYDFNDKKIFFYSVKELLDDYILDESQLCIYISMFKSDEQLPLSLVKNILLKKPCFKTCNVVGGIKRTKYRALDALKGETFTIDTIAGYGVIDRIEDISAIDKLYLRSVISMPNKKFPSRLLSVVETMRIYEKQMKLKRLRFYEKKFGQYFKLLEYQFNDFICMTETESDCVFDNSIYLRIHETPKHTYYTLYLTLCADVYIKIATITESSCEHDKGYFYSLMFNTVDMRREMYKRVDRYFIDVLKKSGNVYLVDDVHFDSFDIDNKIFNFTLEESLAIHEQYNQI